MKNKLRIAVTFLGLLTLLTLCAGAQTTYSKIDQMSGWGSCTDCAGAGGKAVYYMKQNVSSPSLDGRGMKFSVGGSTPFSHGLWWKRVGDGKSSISHFMLDMYFMMPNPGASGGLEFAANQAFGGKQYKFSTQCSFNTFTWRVWDTKNSKWVSTGISCKRPPSNSWQHVIFEYQRVNGQCKFVAITVNGSKHYVNKAFAPRSYGSSGMDIHYQMNGDRNQTDYITYADKINLKVW